MSEEEKRRYPRIPTQQPVWVEGQDRRVSARATNISRGGMFVVSEGAAPEIGSTLQIRFQDPQEGEIEVATQVVWRDETTTTAKLGLKVLDSGGMEAFERVVQRHETGAAEKKRPSREDER